MESNIAIAAYKVAANVAGAAVETAANGTLVQETINAALKSPEVLLGIAFLGGALGAGFWVGVEVVRLIIRAVVSVGRMVWRAAPEKKAARQNDTSTRGARPQVSLDAPRVPGRS